MELSLHQIQVDEHSFSLMLPTDEEASLNAAASGECVDPYWGKLWDSASDTARCILAWDWEHDGEHRKHVLEIGCGAGLAGMAALHAGLDVTFSDHEPQAVELAIKNAALNGFENCEGMVLDWAEPADRKFDAILASDILYQENLHHAILELGHVMLVPDGQICIGDPGRQLARNFLNLATQTGYVISIYDTDLKSMLTPFNNQFQWILLSKN